MTSSDVKTAAILDQLTGSPCITIDGAVSGNDVMMTEITLNNSCINSPNVRIYFFLPKFFDVTTVKKFGLIKK